MARRIRRRRTTVNFMRVVDGTGENVAKRIFVYQKNTDAEFDEVPPAWKSVIINNSSFTFGFNEPYLVNVYKDGYLSRLTPVIKGKRYRFVNGEFAEDGAADSGGEFKFENNGSGTLTVLLSKDGNLIGYRNIPANESWVYGPRPTFWIHAREDLNSTPDISEVNTEISYLGLVSSTILVEKVDSPGGSYYSFSLTDVVYA